MDRGPGRTQRIGDALGDAYQPVRARQFADRDHDPLTPRPIARERVAADIIEHLRIDRLRGPAKRQFAQRGEVGLGEEMRERAGRLVGDVDLAVLEPLDQLVGRDIDHLDLGAFQYPIGNGLAHAHAGEGSDDIVEAFDMLDVDRRKHVDPRRQQFLDILIALGMAAFGRVGVGKLIDQHELGPPREDRVDVHLGEFATLIVDHPPWDDLVPDDEGLGFRAAMRFDHPDHDIGARALAGGTLAQHFIGLADAGRGAEKDLELAARLLLRLAEKGVGIGTIVAHVRGLALSLSSCRLSSSTLTRSSPRKPSKGCSVAPATITRSRASSIPRALAMRGT